MKRFQFWLCLPLLALLAGMPPAARAETDRERDARTGNDIDRSVKPDAPGQQPAAIKEDDFGGSWLWAVGDKRFRLILTQKGDVLTGFHSVEVDGGGKRDMVDGGNQIPSINGQVSGTTTVVRFRSGLPGSEAYGHARITLRGRYLYWELMDSTGEHYFPANAVLVRQEK